MAGTNFHTRRLLPLLQIVQVLVIINFASCYDNTNALLRSQTKDIFLVNQDNVSSPQSVTEVATIQGNATNPQQLNPDYDLEPDTNKTKRSKAPFKWLKGLLGLGAATPVETVTSETDMESESAATDNEDSTTVSSSMTSKFDPFHIKGKVSSKVSGIVSAAKTIAGAVGIGGGGSNEPNGDEMEGPAPDNSEKREVAEDDGSAGATTTSISCYNYVYAVLLTGYLSMSLTR